MRASGLGLLLAPWLLGAPAQALSGVAREFAIESSGVAHAFVGEADSVDDTEEASDSDLELQQLPEISHTSLEEVEKGTRRARFRSQLSVAAEQNADAQAADRLRKSSDDLQRLLLGQVATRVGSVHNGSPAAASAGSHTLSYGIMAGWTLPHLSLAGTISAFLMIFLVLMCLVSLRYDETAATAANVASVNAPQMGWPVVFVFMFLLFCAAGAIVLYDGGPFKKAFNETIMSVYLAFVGIGLIVVVVWQAFSIVYEKTQDIRDDVQAARNFLPDLKHKVDHILQWIGLESDSEGEEVDDIYGRGKKKKMRKKRLLPSLACGSSKTPAEVKQSTAAKASSESQGKGKGNGSNRSHSAGACC